MKRLLRPKFWISRLFFFLHIPLPFRVRVTDRVRIALDPLSVPHALWLNRDKKGKDIEVVQNDVREGDVCVDVGANVGHLALVMAERAKNGTDRKSTRLNSSHSS